MDDSRDVSAAGERPEGRSWLPDHRRALVRALTRAVEAATTTGDLAVARIATESLARLVGVMGGDSTEVVDLSEKRRGRG